MKKQRKKEILWSVVLAGIMLVASMIPAISAPLKSNALYFPIGEGQLVLVNTTSEPIGLTAQALDAEGNPLGRVNVPEALAPATSFTLSLREGFPEEATTLEVKSDQQGVIGFLIDPEGISQMIQGKAAKQPRSVNLFKALQTIKTAQLQRWDQIVDYSQKEFFDRGYHPGECKQFVKIIVCEAGGNKNMVRSSGDYNYDRIRRGMIVQAPLPHTAIALTDYNPNLGVLVVDSNWEGGLGNHKVGVHYLSSKQLKNSGFKGYWAKPGDFGLTDRILRIADSLRFANTFTINR